MPGKVIEKYWNQAKDRASEQDHAEDWPYVMAIYQNMTKNKKKPVTKKALLDALGLCVKEDSIRKLSGFAGILQNLFGKNKTVFSPEPISEAVKTDVVRRKDDFVDKTKTTTALDRPTDYVQ